MRRKLTRLDILEYCNKCKHVSNKSGRTLCGLTNELASFDFECDKFTDKNISTIKGKKSFFGSWKGALIMSILGFLRFGIKLASRQIDILGLVFLILGISWLLVALFSNKD